MKVALFDFDGTLYPYETFQTLRYHMRDNPKYKKYYKHFVRRFAPAYFGHKLKLVPELQFQNKALESYIYAFKGASKDEVETFFSEVGEAMREQLNEAVVERLQWLRDNNYYTILISGAFQPMLKAMFKDEFCHIIGSQVNYNKKDVLSTKIPFVRVFGARKIDLIRNHLKHKNVDWDKSHAYSDSATDLSMLKLVGHPVVVKPDANLKIIANKNGWEILN